MKVVAGDIVQHHDTNGEVSDDRVVVDISEGVAVLRTEQDLALLKPYAVPVTELVVVGHLTSVEGWVETTRGVWKQT